MTLTINSLHPEFNFPRNYMRGFVGSSGMSNLTISGSIVSFDYLTLYHLDLQMSDVFAPCSTNVYSCDFVFDETRSHIYIPPIEIDAGMFVDFHAMTTRPDWAIQLLSNQPVDETVYISLPPCPSVWLPPQA